MPGHLVLDLLAPAAGLVLNPVPVVAVLLLLGTDRARSTGSAFALGWVVGMLAVSAAGVALATEGGAADDDGTHPAVAAATALVGVGLLVVAVTQWRARSRGEGKAPPAWVASLDEVAPRRAFVLGAGLAALNPKTLALILAAAGAIAEAGLSAGGDVAALGAFLVVGSLGVTGPVLALLVLGERARPALGRAAQLVTAHGTAAVAVVSLVLGLVLLTDGVTGLLD